MFEPPVWATITTAVAPALDAAADAAVVVAARPRAMIVAPRNSSWFLTFCRGRIDGFLWSLEGGLPSRASRGLNFAIQGVDVS